MLSIVSTSSAVIENAIAIVAPTMNAKESIRLSRPIGSNGRRSKISTSIGWRKISLVKRDVATARYRAQVMPVYMIMLVTLQFLDEFDF